LQQSILINCIYILTDIIFFDKNISDNIDRTDSILNIKVDTGEYKAWKSSWDNAAKRAYSLTSFLQQFAVPISIAIVLLACFVGFAILFTRIGSVCGQ
jgi:hypothetical protein